MGDDRTTVMGRPFVNAQDCGETILTNFKNFIQPGDDLYVAGDLAMDQSWLERFDEATKHAASRLLVKGNYDRLDDAEYLKVFDDVTDKFLDFDLYSGESVLPCRLHHYPSQYAIPERFSLCGHIHNAWLIQKNMLNLSVDVHHFLPITGEKVSFYFNGICDFFDDDVWVAGHPANSAHNHRGRPSTYWARGFGGSR